MAICNIFFLKEAYKNLETQMSVGPKKLSRKSQHFKNAKISIKYFSTCRIIFKA